MQKPIQNTATARLNITDLPGLTDSMSKGGMYALIAETPPTRFPILASCLYAALQDQLPCTVILPEQPETFIERLESFGQLDTEDALSSGVLQILLCQNDFAKKMFKFGVETFASELERFDTRPGGLLIFDKADELFSLHDVSLALAQADVLSRWFTERGITALFCFNSLAEEEAGNLQALMDKLSGLVQIVGERDGLALAFDYWQSPEGTIASKHYPLVSQDLGLYKVRTGAVANDDKPPLASGVGQFYHMDAQLDSMYQQLPGEWHFVDSLVGMVYATRGSQSATVVLSFEHGSKLRELAETVHTLRLGLGKRACIVVHEKKSSLRYQNEALLLRLGVNLVIHRDVPVSRLPLLLESVKGQVFERRMDINFEAALASVLPSSLRGYQPPAHFAREVRDIMERSETIGIPCTLLVGTPVHGTDLAALLSGIVLGRAGDLSSSDGESCYLFLNGCPESAILAAVERLLGKHMDAVFQRHRFVTRRPDIHAELDALVRLTELRNLPDLAPLVALASADKKPDAAIPASETATIPAEATPPRAKPEVGAISGLFKAQGNEQAAAASGRHSHGDTTVGNTSGLFKRAGGSPLGSISGMYKKSTDAQPGTASGLFKKMNSEQHSPSDTTADVASAPQAEEVRTAPVPARTREAGENHIVFGKDPVPRAQRSIQRPDAHKAK